MYEPVHILAFNGCFFQTSSMSVRASSYTTAQRNPTINEGLMLNMSSVFLLLGHIPQAFKVAVIKALLKKLSLKAEMS